MKIRDAIQEMQRIGLDEPCCYSVFTRDDVREAANDGDLTDSYCDRILHRVDVGFDSDVGINWTVIRNAIDQDAKEIFG